MFNDLRLCRFIHREELLPKENKNPPDGWILLFLYFVVPFH